MSKDRQARVSEAAYRIWQREGFPEGRDIEHWLEAEREVQEAEQREAKGMEGGTEVQADPKAKEKPAVKKSPVKPAVSAESEAGKVRARKSTSGKVGTPGSDK